MARQRRLRDIQAHGGAPEVQFFGNGDEIAEAAQVEHFCSGGINGDENGIGARVGRRSDCGLDQTGRQA
ncbi:hypothetical protein [Paraburkholderia hiiakae]|uniref:hypothetical protein n=1 Tax=Paraburkholderia hiiakae TaxID=1081782 RepID=UPI001F4735EC|nr:hypothetical protein [Paraburkholderia hiiakae]